MRCRKGAFPFINYTNAKRTGASLLMINVFLDDLRSAPPGFVLARTANEAVRLLSSNSVDVLSLDYDLGWDQPTGYEVAKFMVEHRLFPRHVIIHSANPFGRARMYRLLSRFKPKGMTIDIRPLPMW